MIRNQPNSSGAMPFECSVPELGRPNRSIDHDFECSAQAVHETSVARPKLSCRGSTKSPCASRVAHYMLMVMHSASPDLTETAQEVASRDLAAVCPSAILSPDLLSPASTSSIRYGE